jgi:hypothetical protein
MLRYLNHLLEHTLPLFSPPSSDQVNTTDLTPIPKKIIDELIPQSITLTKTTTPPSYSSCFVPKSIHHNGCVVWPIYQFTWTLSSTSSTTISPSSPPHIDTSAISNFTTSHFSLVSCARACLFTDLKIAHFWKILNSSIARVSKTDDDYDYPEDLPLVKINRFRSFRGIETAELSHRPGEDLLYSSMFCQLWKELRQYPDEKLRISYTHPMDDGQSRTFKIKFEGEGVDDYGGPYREIFQKLCEELQAQDPSNFFSSPSSLSSSSSSQSTESLLSGERVSHPCFLPILFPTKNWQTADDNCTERYKYIFHPSSTSSIRLDLFTFLGQFVGIALRSKITLDLPLASYIWKSILREPLTEKDIASYDLTSYHFIHYLSSLYQKLQIEQNCFDLTNYQIIFQEISEVLQDVRWCVEYSNGEIIDLIPNGRHCNVEMNDLESFLVAYVKCKLQECYEAIEAFRSGLLIVIPESSINILCWSELEQLVCGSRVIDVERLMANTEYDDDISPSDRHIQFFWEVLNEFSEEEKSLFLRFVWARPTLPPKDIEFPQKLKIQSAVGDDASLKPDQYLPKAHTCFFSVNLPRYSSKTVSQLTLFLYLTSVI